LCSWCVVGCVCIDLWRASCVEDAMCYTITICIRLTPSRSVRSEACDEGMSSIHVFFVSLLVMAGACCYYADSWGLSGCCRKVVVREVRMKGRRGPKNRVVCETCLEWLLDDKLADAIEPGRYTHAPEQTTPLPCNDAMTMLGGHPFSLISVANHLFCTHMYLIRRLWESTRAWNNMPAKRRSRCVGRSCFLLLSVTAFSLHLFVFYSKAPLAARVFTATMLIWTVVSRRLLKRCTCRVEILRTSRGLFADHAGTGLLKRAWRPSRSTHRQSQ
jgi:hypothetical protein